MVTREEMVKLQRDRQAWARKVDRKSWDEYWAKVQARIVVHPTRHAA
jgi:hypothetical protein